ncbi:probable tRNA methyltransferase 9B [Sphaerodactylus townsendi]|uniref:Uncharacterized protein n=1 Tax=Sphaerodactylus townsendi TaxID=933632 RepID=A0ACB8E7J9_9SAUR|nr:probable tRNA methyltransferase 9B [Sphaerodactylus townsendi]XP_048366081.1 probable tRNA methyltransferase 9B [Sphaerodactylus townsendi]XP_048366082.1 probable tRNA methyltransferase 9B [Sphaerodactylus townsendi]
MEQEASQLEKKHVHSVYESTATYFHDLQSKAWPRVRQFLLEQPPGSLIADIGCGTGKYLDVNSQLYNLGCDYCGPLVEIARNNGCEVMICDNLNLPFRGQCFNAIISVGVIHHFSTKQRRIKAIKEMARVLVPGGHMMIYVWAMEQKTRRFEKQDVFVPWNRALCSQLLSETNKAGLRNDLAHSVKSQTQPLQRLMDSENSYPLALNRKHPHRTEGCLAEACCAKMSDEEENRFYSVLGRSFRAWFSSRSLDESTLQKPNGKLEPLRNTAEWTNSTVSVQPSRHCSLDFGRQGALLKGQRLDDYEEVFMKHVACRKMEWLTASRSLRDFNGEPPLLARNKNGETLFLNGPIENISNGCVCQGRSLSGKHLKRTSSAGSSESIVDAAVAVGDQTAHSLDSKDFMRYYHVFREGELCSLLEESVPEVHILSSSYDHGNWCIIVEKRDVQPQV